MAEFRLEIRLLGGFRALRDGGAVGGFESQKVRGLLAYLGVAHRRSFSRDHLAALLWPEESDETARRNLRQAIYNLRQLLEGLGEEGELLEVSRQEVTLRRTPEVWLDVDAFEAALAQAREGKDGVDVPALAAAARLYEGDFLAGFHVSDALEFEEWLTAEQERLREGAIDALLRLMDHHLEHGTYSLGIEYGRRLVHIDPLSEEARRKLMRLHAFSGRRSRAIAEYHELERLLAEELGVAPVEATREEYRAILDEELPGREIGERAEPVGPLVPLVGREAALSRLRETWTAVTASRARLTLVTGEAGVGKTRLVKTFLHETTGEPPPLVLQGRYHERAPLIPYFGIAQALESGVTHEVEVADRLLASLDRETLAELALLIPALDDLQPGPHLRISSSGGQERLFESVAKALRSLELQEDGKRRPVVLFLDDLHAADPSSLELLGSLQGRLEGQPVWIVATWTLAPEGGEPAGLPGFFEGAETVRLERLGAAEVGKIAEALVPGEAGLRLAGMLAESEGLPLTLTETINSLWDTGYLVELSDGSWALGSPPDPGEIGRSLTELVQGRLAGLPTSARRLLTLAAVAGPEFDAEFLARAEHEDGAVVEAGIRVLLERWMGRLRLGYWADSRRERDISLWASGPRHGRFEFSHPALREAVYLSVDPARRPVLHRRVADVLEESETLASSRWRSETLAYHTFQGRSWERAVAFSEKAAESSLRLGALPTARGHCARALEALEALSVESPGGDGPWGAARERVESLARQAAS